MAQLTAKQQTTFQTWFAASINNKFRATGQEHFCKVGLREGLIQQVHGATEWWDGYRGHYEIKGFTDLYEWTPAGKAQFRVKQVTDFDVKSVLANLDGTLSVSGIAKIKEQEYPDIEPPDGFRHV